MIIIVLTGLEDMFEAAFIKDESENTDKNIFDDVKSVNE